MRTPSGPRTWTVRLLWALACIGALAAWRMVGPVQLGGSVSYVVTSGNSMEPKLTEGDIVVVRESSSYEVGDVVAYDHPDFGVPVLHRIVKERGPRFVIKGDNNDFLDSYEPTEPEMIGKSWFVIPGGGRYLRMLLSPQAIALAVFFLSFSMFRSFGEDEDDDQLEETVPGLEASGAEVLA